MWVKVFLVCVAFCAVSADLVDHLTLEQCGSDSSPIRVDHITMSPVPIPLPGQVHVGGTVRLLENLPPQTIIHLKMYRETHIIFPIDVKIPCIGTMGSCNRDICDLITTSSDLLCDFFPKDRPCKCPIQAGTYSVEDFVYTMPELGGLIKWFAEANFKLEVRVTDGATHRELGCFKVKISLTTHPN